MKNKVLFLGLDAFERDLLERWTADGSLPVIQSIAERGIGGTVSNPDVFGSNVVWISLISGLNLGSHGSYYPKAIRSGTYEHKDAFPKDLGINPFWTAIAASGKRVAIIDIPEAPLTQDINGIQIVDWGSHDKNYNPPVSFPSTLIEEIRAKYGDEPVGACDNYRATDSERIKLRDRLLQRIDTKAEMICDLLSREDWDLFLAGFQDAHCIGHICWHMHDTSHAAHPTALVEKEGDPVKQVYMALDRAIGKIISQVDADTRVVLFAGPGMGPYYNGNHVLDEVLRRLDGKPPALDRRLLNKTKDTFKFAVRTLPEGMRRNIVRYGKSLERNRASKDWRDRSCFLLVPHNDISGAIRLNIVGREPNGVIPPEEVDAYVEQLTKDLLEVKNLDTGEPLIKKVYRTREICHGDKLDDLPDLFVQWNRSAPIARVGSKKVGEVAREPIAVRSGDHTAHCCFFTFGPGVHPGKANQQIALTDFAPTLASMVEADAADWEGKVIEPLASP